MMYEVLHWARSKAQKHQAAGSGEPLSRPSVGRDLGEWAS